MNTIAKVGISAIGAAAVAGVGYLGKKAYDKKKNKSINAKTDDTSVEVTVNDSEMSENENDQ